MFPWPRGFSGTGRLFVSILGFAFMGVARRRTVLSCGAGVASSLLAGWLVAFARDVIALCGNIARNLYNSCTVRDQLQTGRTDEMNADFGHDEIHGNIVRLRLDRGHSGLFERHADLERLRRHRGKCPVEVAATVSEPVAAQIKTDRRNE